MDQLKGVMVAVKKYHFWVLCAIVVVGGLAIWQTSAADWEGRYRKGRTDLESQLGLVRTVRDEKEVHNNDTLQMLRDRQGEQTEEVWRARDILYRDQQMANQWPQEVGKDFLAMIEFLKWGDTIPDTQRYEYAMFIKTYLPRLKRDLKMRMSQQQWDDLQREIEGRPTGVTVRKKGSAKKAATSKGSSDAAADATKTPAEQSQLDELVGLVVWDDYNRLLEHFPWGASPTPLEIWLAQEDLWVYKALLQIIMETNSGASSHSNAPVKRIVTMEIAQYAAQALVSSQGR